VACAGEDVRCGMLHCSHLNERLEFGMESVAILSHSFINSGGKIIPCRTALVDLGKCFAGGNSFFSWLYFLQGEHYQGREKCWVLRHAGG
jgi:hypothetical protein